MASKEIYYNGTMKIIDREGRKLKRFAAMSRPKNAKGEWTYLYFWAANQKEAETYHNDLHPNKGQYMDYKLKRIKEKK